MDTNFSYLFNYFPRHVEMLTLHIYVQIPMTLVYHQQKDISLFSPKSDLSLSPTPIFSPINVGFWSVSPTVRPAA